MRWLVLRGCSLWLHAKSMISACVFCFNSCSIIFREFWEFSENFLGTVSFVRVKVPTKNHSGVWAYQPKVAMPCECDNQKPQLRLSVCDLTWSVVGKRTTNPRAIHSWKPRRCSESQRYLRVYDGKCHLFNSHSINFTKTLLGYCLLI